MSRRLWRLPRFRLLPLVCLIIRVVVVVTVIIVVVVIIIFLSVLGRQKRLGDRRGRLVVLLVVVDGVGRVDVGADRILPQRFVLHLLALRVLAGTGLPELTHK